MPYTLVRNETITYARARGAAFDVVDLATMQSLGVIVDGLPGWRVHSAGPGVPVDQNTWHKSALIAREALLAAREAAEQPGGMLHVDESGLSGFHRAVLDFADERYKYIGTREAEIWARFDMSPTVYSFHLLKLLDEPLAAAYAPQTVSRQSRLRDERKAARSGAGRAS